MTGADILDSRIAWARLGITLLVATIGNVGLWSIIVVMPSVEAEFGIGRAAASVPYTVTMLGFAVGNVVIGRVLDRFGIARALVGAALTIAAGYGLSTITTGVAGLAAAQALIGLGTAACFGPLAADISHWFQRRRGIAVAIAASGNYLAGAVWPMLLAGVLEDSGWRTVNLILAMTVAGTLLPLAVLLRRRVPAEAQAHSARIAAQQARSIAFSPRMLTWLLAAAGLGCCMAMAMPQVHIVSFCADLGYGPAVGAEMLSLMLLGGVVSRIASGWVADRLGGVPTLLIGATLQCLALMLYLPFDSLVSLYVVSAIFGLSQGGLVPTYAIIVREYLPPREAGARVGLVLMATILGMALGGWMSGLIRDLTGDYHWAFVNGIAWNLLTIGVMIVLLWRSGDPRRRGATAVA
ncbi:MAG: MFS transporter [Rhodobacteraceae bacterium]|nr:MFS transporter [Paracoccaceae bacterium]